MPENRWQEMAMQARRPPQPEVLRGTHAQRGEEAHGETRAFKSQRGEEACCETRTFEAHSCRDSSRGTPCHN